MNVTDSIILGLLSISTIRWLLARTLNIPTDKTYSWLFHDKYDSTIVTKVLDQIGLPIEKIRGEITKLRLPKSADIFDEIICLCITHISQFAEKRSYGIDSPLDYSHYYINTMEAVHYDREREIMANGILNLFHECEQFPNFIITPKSGNPYLSFEIHRKQPILYAIMIKNPRDGSFSTGSKEENFEGLNKFIEDITSKNPDQKYYGIAVDCNAAGCTNLINSIRLFNDMIRETNHTNILPVEEAVILFRADDKKDIDSDKSIKFHRYFDLTEEKKKEMYDCIPRGDHLINIKPNDKNYMKIIQDLKDSLKCDRLIKSEVAIR